MRGLFRAYDINNERYICEIINESVGFFITSINEVYIEFKIDSYLKKYMVGSALFQGTLRYIFTVTTKNIWKDI